MGQPSYTDRERFLQLGERFFRLGGRFFRLGGRFLEEETPLNRLDG